MTDVAIIGAGPVGLLCALLLGQSGVSVTVFERWSSFYPLPRACTIDHEVMRILQDAGLIEELRPLTDPVIGPDRPYRFLDAAGETLLQIDWNRSGASGWAQANGFFQPDLERMLVRRLSTLPHVDIRRGCELTGLTQDAERVDLTFEDEGEGPFSTRARHIVGADGARSKVRELLEISQTDLGFSYEWLVIDVVPSEERVWHPYVVQHCDPARPTSLVNSGPGRRRWEFMRLPGETVEELNTAEAAWRLLARWDITPENASIERHAVYTFRGLWANRWQNGRALLAGDAAHLMPPFLGQGLCSGMRDAKALSWRLAAIIRDGAPASLLDSYGPERTTHVQEIIRQAVDLGRIICALDPDEVTARDERMKAAIRDPLLALKPPPEPRLGDGKAYRRDDDQAGYLSVQGLVRYDGREGLFDDVVGQGWQLLVRTAGSPLLFDDEARDVARSLDLVVADFGPKGDTVDLEGAYGAWFDRLGVDAVLVRPDFYIFGTASVADIGALVVATRDVVGAGKPPEREGHLGRHRRLENRDDRQ